MDIRSKLLNADPSKFRKVAKRTPAEVIRTNSPTNNGPMVTPGVVASLANLLTEAKRGMSVNELVDALVTLHGGSAVSRKNTVRTQLSSGRLARTYELEIVKSKPDGKTTMYRAVPLVEDFADEGDEIEG